jgi:hypothetical protein
MKPFRIAIGATVAVGAFAALVVPASAQAPSPKVPVPVYADTVSSSRGDVKLSRVCTQTNLFPRKARVVFRAWAMDSTTGKPLTPLDIRYAYVKIPGQPNLALNWGAHGTAPNRVSFWSAAWAIPADYPLGVVPFRIVFKTEDGTFGIFQQPVIEGQQLTVTP